MKAITILPPIELVDALGTTLKKTDGSPQVMSHSEFIRGRLIDPAFGRSMRTLLSAVTIRDKVASAHVGQEIVLDNEDWTILKEAVENPTGGYNPTVAMNCINFMLAIVEAENK